MNEKRIGSFELQRSLGKGGMGEVFLAKDLNCERLIALKKIREDLAKHKTMQMRFLREAKIAAKLTHPSIIPIYTISEERENTYYTMPYIEGETLKEILHEALKREKNGDTPHPIGSSVPGLVRIFLSICQAIAYAHSRGVLHRDLKPDNVIVGKYGEVMLVDWGIAEELVSTSEEASEFKTEESILTRPGKIPGTLSHLAPERALGEKASFLTDIYALGVMLYQILTLRLPFYRSSLENFRKHLASEDFLDPQEVAPYRDIPPQLVTITKRCLTAKGKRIHSVQALIDELQNYIEGKPEWVLGGELSVKEKRDWEFQENILLAKHLAITRTPEVMEWVNLMYSRASFPGNIRIETKIFLGPRGKGMGILLGIPEASERIGFADGYSVWLSSDSDSSSKLFRSDAEVMALPQAILSPQIWHTLCIEKLDNHLRVFLDGRLHCHYISHRPLTGTHVGLLFRDADFEMEPLKIFLGSQSVQVNCLAVPDAFLGSHLFGKALSEYRRIGYSFPGRAEGREALFRAGITLLEEALTEQKKKRKQQLFSLALTEFGKLRATAGAPLEYLGKSLVYKAWNDLEDEVKCLELALRKYPKHPLLPLLVEEISFRLHECSAQNRYAGLLFTLLVLRQLPHLFSSQENQRLLESLQKSLEPLSFIEQPEGDETSFIHLSIQLAVWMGKPITLLEILEQTKERDLIENILFSLLHLGCFEMCREAALHLEAKEQARFECAFISEKKPLLALNRALQHFPEDNRLLSFILLRIASKREPTALPTLPAACQEPALRIFLSQKKWEAARACFANVSVQPGSPYFALYG
ncbi:MAG: protein kinase, partial [Chlamydiales bacterium]